MTTTTTNNAILFVITNSTMVVNNNNWTSMTNSNINEDNNGQPQGFVNYHETTIDPGWKLVVGIAIFAWIINVGLLPYWVQLVNRINQFVSSTSSSIPPPPCHTTGSSSRIAKTAPIRTTTAITATTINQEEQQHDNHDKANIMDKKDSDIVTGHEAKGYDDDDDDDDDNEEDVSHDNSYHDGELEVAPLLRIETFLPTTSTISTIRSSNHNHNDDITILISHDIASISSSTGNGNEFWESMVWDSEMKRLLELAVPFGLQGFMDGLFGLVVVAVIGHYLGSRQANAYIVVSMLSDLTNTITRGFYEALNTLGPQAVGVGNSKLTGQYLQLSILFYILGGIPQVLFWAYGTETAILWLGFDDDTARIGQAYSIPYNLYKVVLGIQLCLNEFLLVTDHEGFSVATQTIQFVLQTLVLIGASAAFQGKNDVRGSDGDDGMAGLVVNRATSTTSSTIYDTSAEDDLTIIGYCQVCFTLFYGLIILYFVFRQGWLNEYWDGLTQTWAMSNRKAVSNMLRTAVPLSLIWIWTYGEWELMTIFVRAMGPAEVAAWGLLGCLWEVLEHMSHAIASAGAVRVGHYMGEGKYDMARKLTYKTISLALVAAVVIASLLCLVAQPMLSWLTPDPTLQHMIYNALPLVGMSQVILATSIVCVSVLGAQGRYRFASTTAWLGSWCVSIPLAIILVHKCGWNLKGPVAASVIGSTLSGAAQIAMVLSSDWRQLSKTIAQQHEASITSLFSSSSLDSLELGRPVNLSGSHPTVTRRSTSRTSSSSLLFA